MDRAAKTKRTRLHPCSIGLVLVWLLCIGRLSSAAEMQVEYNGDMLATLGIQPAEDIAAPLFSSHVERKTFVLPQQPPPRPEGPPRGGGNGGKEKSKSSKSTKKSSEGKGGRDDPRDRPDSGKGGGKGERDDERDPRPSGKGKGGIKSSKSSKKSSKSSKSERKSGKGKS